MMLPAMLLLFPHLSAFAQQPGGVSGTRLWLVTEKKGPSAYQLVDISGNGWGDFLTNPVSDARVINFHPAAELIGTEKKKTLKNFSFTQGTVAGIFYPEKGNDTSRQYVNLEYQKTSESQRATSYYSNKAFKYGFKDPAQRNHFLTSTAATSPATSMKTVVMYKADRKELLSIWGQDKSTTLLSSFKGYLPELIIYNRVLSTTEKMKLESYLAIKYGITLDTHYVASNGRLLWSFDDPMLSGFRNRVCAIGKDSLAGIKQPKSNTTYEEGPHSSFDKDADDFKQKTGWTFIPTADSPSLYRSVTINYVDQSMQSVKDSSYIFLADDAAAVTLGPDVAPAQYPGLKIVPRNWVLYNADKSADPVRVMIAGKDFDDKVLFGNIYNAYDYQLYRYVIVRWTAKPPAQIDTLLLCDHFGREQFSNLRFFTRTIVWDSVLTKKNKYTYFTIGRVPILNFLNCGKTIHDSTELKYPYYKETEIIAKTVYDTLRFQFGPTEVPCKLLFKTSEGVSPLMPQLFMLKGNKRIQLTGTIKKNVPLPSPTPGQVTSPQPTTEQKPEETGALVQDTTTSPPGTKHKILGIKRDTPAKKQAGPIYTVTFPERNTRYLIVIKDKIKQEAELPIVIF